MSHIFISYSRSDLKLAQKIVDALSACKLDTWIDWKSIPKGEDWEQEIYRGIEEADAFLFLISPDSVKSEMCNREIAHAVKNGKRILPVFIADAENKRIYDVTDQFLYNEQKEEIHRRNFIICRQGSDEFNTAIGEIQTTIHTDYEWVKYHTKLLVKALDWERHKDDSRLLRGKELRESYRLLALAGKDTYPVPTDLQRQYLSASQKHENRLVSRTRLFGSVFLVTLILVGIAGIVLLDRTPARVNVDGQVFEIRNRSGYRFLSQDVGSTISVYAEPQKLAPDGGYLFVVGTGTDGAHPGTVLAYDMRGNIKWQYSVEADPYQGPPGNFKIIRIIVDEILGNDRSQIIFTAQKSDWFPTELVVLDAEGKLFASYWNSGFIYDVLRQDLDADGIKELVISAVNNNLGWLVDERSKHPVIVYVLSPKEDFTGQTFPVLIPDWPFGTEYHNWIAVFEPFTVTGIHLRTANVDGKNLIEIVFNPQGGYIWLDEFGRIQNVGLSDYWQTLPEGEKSPADFICYLTLEGDGWHIYGRIDSDVSCPWYVGE